MTLGVGLNLALRLDRLAALLGADEPGVSVADLTERTGFHKTMIGSLRSWARHLDLLDGRGHRTTFAEVVLDHDPRLERHVTKVLLYARLAANPAAEMFFFLVNHVLYEQVVVGASWPIEGLEAAARSAGVGGRSSASRQHKRELALMLNLVTTGAFAELHVVERDAAELRADPLELSPSVVAYLIADAWPVNTAYRTFAELERPGGLSRVALVRRPGLIHLLRMAEQAGWLVVEQEAGLDRVARRGEHDPLQLLVTCYAS